MINSSKKYTDAAENMKQYLMSCKQLKSSKNMVVLTGEIEDFDQETSKNIKKELKVTFFDNEPKSKDETEFRSSLAEQVPEMANVFNSKTLIKFEQKSGKKWLETSSDIVKSLKKI